MTVIRYFRCAASKDVICEKALKNKNKCRTSPCSSIAPLLSSTRVDRAIKEQHNETSLKLHISNIAIEVNEKEVLQMISNAIGVYQVHHVSSLDYISFKIGIDISYRETALQILNWPNGERCVEFVDCRATTWRPARRNWFRDSCPGTSKEICQETLLQEIFRGSFRNSSTTLFVTPTVSCSKFRVYRLNCVI